MVVDGSAIFVGYTDLACLRVRGHRRCRLLLRISPLVDWWPWNRKPPSDASQGETKERIGYRGRPGSTTTFRGTRWFGQKLDTDIDNEGDIDVEDSDVG